MKYPNMVEYLSGIRDWVVMCKNWYVIPLVSLRIKKDNICLSLRNGLELMMPNLGEYRDTIILRDLYVNRPYTLKGEYFPDNEDVCIVDIGAHIGLWSVLIAHKSKNVRLLSYEPHPFNYRCMVCNIGHNRLQNRIKAFNMAVTGTDGRVKLYIDSKTSIHSIYFDWTDTDAFIEVPSTTLKKIFIDNKLATIDFLKLDCEGAEYEILFNTPKTYLRKIKKIALEAHLVDGYSISQLKDFLSDCGFDLMHIKGKLERSQIKGMLYAWRNQ